MVEANSSGRVSRKPAGSTGAGGSGREPLAALTAATGENRAPGPGAHPQPETVRTRPAAVVRLESALALAHGRLSPGRRRGSVPAAGLFWCWTVVRDGAAVVVLCRDPEPTVIALVRGGARQALVRTRLSTDTLEARVRSGARGGQTAPVAPLGGVPERGE
jgi:hypothetical protein